MLESVKLENFGPLPALEWRGLGKINVVIGGNGTGKTFLLKTLYSAMRTLEEYQRGDDQRSANEILAHKLYWTFQGKIGDLVTKGSKGSLECAVEFSGAPFRYGFGRDTSKQITSLDNSVPQRASNSVFLPAKEVLSLQKIILKSRENDREFGFDDTYLDLARALRNSTTKGRNYPEFAKSRSDLEAIIGGRIEFDEAVGDWQYRRGNQRFSIGVTAEGIKKIGILDTLLGNRYLDTQSVIFIDEPEAALHPVAISKLMDIVFMLAERGIQFFLATHSYFVVKKLFLLAQKNSVSMPVISLESDGPRYSDLRDEMPSNSIIDESIRLYREEMEVALG